MKRQRNTTTSKKKSNLMQQDRLAAFRIGEPALTFSPSPAIYCRT
ncbi:hypothetical protein CAter10_2310 [Collimonas arenae]|nr:hypothetical protein CAter10_2310 [Collimonas arenae]